MQTIVYMALTKYSNGQITCNTETFWCNILSDCRPYGPINNFTLNCLLKNPKKTLYWFPQSDGCMVNIDLKDLENMKKKAAEEGATLIVPTLALDEYDPENFICMPLDDQTFRDGIAVMFPRQLIQPWDTRKPIVFWRGSCAGYDDHRSRHRTVEKLLDKPGTDVKLIGTYAERCPETPRTYFAEPVHIIDHFNYKYLLIIDGHKIASNHQWIFATGAVPLMISNKYFWFVSELEPFVNYIPIKYDLSDLEEKIDWLTSHDEEARKIGENARLMAERVFSSEYQKNYIQKELARLILL